MRPLYAIFHYVNECYPYILMGVYIIAFFIAFAMMFIMPQISLLLLFVGLYSLAVAVGVWKLSKYVERRLAQALLDRGVCPHCGHAAAPPFISPCPSCLTNYETHAAEGAAPPALGTGIGGTSG